MSLKLAGTISLRGKSTLEVHQHDLRQFVVMVSDVTEGHAIQGLVQRQLLLRTRRYQASKCVSTTPGGCSECLAGPAKRCTRSAELGAEIALSKPERLPRLLVSLATEWLDTSTTDARDSGPKVRLQPCLLDSDVADCDMPQQITNQLHDRLLLLQMFYEGPSQYTCQQVRTCISEQTRQNEARNILQSVLCFRCLSRYSRSAEAFVLLYKGLLDS